MPLAPGYEPRIMPEAGQAMPLASAESYGAGIGQSLAQAGEQLHSDQIRAFQIEKKRAQDSQLADWSSRFAKYRQDMSDYALQQRNIAGPGAVGHTAAIQKQAEAQRDALFTGISDKTVQLHAREQWDEFATKLHNSESDFETSSGIAKVVTDRSDALDLAANRVRHGSGEDPKAYSDELRIALSDNQALNVDDATRQKLNKYAEEKMGAAYVQHLQDVNPRLARASLDSGAFDHLPPALLEQLRNGSDVEIRRADAAGQHQIAVEKGQYTEALATVTAKAAQGIDVSGDLPALAQQATRFGDTSGLENLKKLDRESRYAKIWGGTPPLQRENRIIELQKVLPAKRSEDQQAELAWLNEKRGGLDSQFHNDPIGFVETHGKPNEQPPALDPAHPETFAARAQWAQSMVPAYGSMNLLSGNEVKALNQQRQSGANGEAQVIAQLSQFGGAYAKAAARQVDPNDAYLQHVVTLPGDIQHMALQGKQARKADPTIIHTDDPDIKEGLGFTAASLDQALAALPITDRNAVLETARDIAAYKLRESHAGPKSINGAVWWQSVNAALGARGLGKDQKGGIGNWPGDHAFLVPSGMTQNQFVNTVFDLVKKHPEKAPLNADGSPANLRYAYPVWVRPGVYKFMVGNRDVIGRDAKGKPGGTWNLYLNGAQ